MLGLATSSTYTCPDDDPDLCDGRTFAYVYPSDSTQTIYVCEFTFNYPDYAEKVQTVIHELSHFNSIGSTTDNAYGEETCYQLAQSDPATARRIADNYGYFAVYTNACYLNAPAGYTPYSPPCKSCAVGTGSTTALVCGATSAPTTPAPTASSGNSAVRAGSAGGSLVVLWLAYVLF